MFADELGQGKSNKKGGVEEAQGLMVGDLNFTMPGREHSREVGRHLAARPRLICFKFTLNMTIDNTNCTEHILPLNSYKAVLWIRINMMRNRIRGSASEITDPDPALGERFLRVLFPLLVFP